MGAALDRWQNRQMKQLKSEGWKENDVRPLRIKYEGGICDCSPSPLSSPLGERRLEDLYF